MKHFDDIDDIRDDQIRIVGHNWKKPNPRWYKRPLVIIGILIAISVISTIIWRVYEKSVQEELLAPEPALFDPETPEDNLIQPELCPFEPISIKTDSTLCGYIDIRDTLINDISLKLYIPHDAELTLHVGEVNQQDSSIIFMAQAADVRADNGEIVGAFVLKGEPLAWGLSKKGYCASINGKITIGVAESTPLFEEATENEGYFFRQYPLVGNRKVIENKPKGKSIRRAICDRSGEIFMVESKTPESFHDFAQSLVDLGVDNAVYIVGSTAYGWAIDERGVKQEFGVKNKYMRIRNGILPKYSFIIWRKKN